MNVLELFAGIGGIGLGLERAGMTVVGQVELDDYCQRVLTKHWPEVPKHDDVRTCIEWWYSQPGPDVDLITGGFPCQPVSYAGRGLAQADDRWLWPDMANVIRALRPRYVLVENVPGLIDRGFDDVQSDLAAIGYDTDWDCIPASSVGAPHIRERIFLVAHTDRDQHQSRTPPVGRPTTEVVPLANPDDERRNGRPRIVGTKGRGQPTNRRRHVAHPDRSTNIRGVAQPIFGDVPRRHESPGSQWAVEPPVGRVAYGVPARVDRLRALGNAVVPQVAEHVGRLILAHDEVAA